MSYAKKYAWTTCLSGACFLPFFGLGAFTVTVCEPANQMRGPDWPASRPTWRFGRPVKPSAYRTRCATVPSLGASQRNSVGLATKHRSPAASAAWPLAASARCQTRLPVRRSTALAWLSLVTTSSRSRQSAVVSGEDSEAGWE